ELFKAPDAVVHDDVGLGDHLAQPLFGLLWGLLADAENRGHLLISRGTGPLPGIRTAAAAVGQPAAGQIVNTSLPRTCPLSHRRGLDGHFYDGQRRENVTDGRP